MVILQEMSYIKFVSSGRYMKQLSILMLKLGADWLFWGCFAGLKTVFFLGKNCFAEG
jgi:hypothetical protein